MRNRAVKTMRTTSVYSNCTNSQEERYSGEKHIPTSADQPVTPRFAVTPTLPVNIGVVEIDTYSHAALIDDAIDHALDSSSTRQVVNAKFYVLAQKSSGFRGCNSPKNIVAIQ